MSARYGFKVACFVLAAAAAAISFAPAAEATPVTHDFAVHVTSGPLAGSVENGSFSYDSSSITPGGFNSASGLLTAFDFTFDGITYDAGSANTGLLGFDAAGDLTSFFISSSCISLGCTFSAGTENFTVTPGMNGFVYSTSSFQNYGFGDVTFAPVRASVPEPGTLGLFGFGLLLLGAAARRRLALRRLPG